MTAVSSGPVLAVASVLVAGAAARGTWSPCGLSMVSAINPFSERSRGHRYGATVLWFVLGAVAGGALLGAVGAVGAIGIRAVGLPPAVLGAVAAACCLGAAAGDADSVPFRLPLIPRQVNERWLSGYRRWFYASGFGAQIGFGLATYVMTAAVYLVPVLGALSGSPSLALAGGVLFGLVRGLAILLTSAVRTPLQLRELHRRLALLAPRSRQAVLVLEVVASLAFAVAVNGAVAVAVGVAVVAAMVGSRRSAVDRRPAPTRAGG